MKILLIASQTPYPTNRAEQIRVFHLLAELAKWHTVSLAYSICDPAEIRHANVLRNLCKRGSVTPVYLNQTSALFRGLRALLQGRSYDQGYFSDDTFKVEIERLNKKEVFDLIYVSTPAMAQFVPDWSDAPIVVDFVDVESGKWAEVFPSMLFSLERRRRLRFGCAVASKATGLIFASQLDADSFQRCAGEASAHVVPNGVSLELRRLPVGESYGDGNSAPMLTFVGALDNYSNQEAVRYFVAEILPRVKQQCPETSLRIVGCTPALVARLFAGVRGITITQNPSDVRACLVQSDVSVVPHKASVLCQNEVLEALALGVPVVASSEAIKTLPSIFKDKVLVGDHPAAFAAHILRLVRDLDYYRSVAAKGRKFAAQHFSWKAVGAKLAGVIENLVQPTHERAKNIFEAKHGAR